MQRRPGTDGPNPRLILAFLALILVAQGFYAALAVFAETPAPAGPMQSVVVVAFVVYVAMIAAFAFGAWGRQPWAWALAVVVAGFGLALALLQVAAGDRVEDHLFGMVIDGLLLYYLNKPTIKALFEA